jgi:hypothetical protein
MLEYIILKTIIEFTSKYLYKKNEIYGMNSIIKKLIVVSTVKIKSISLILV